MLKASYHPSVHEKSSFPAELLHRQLQQSGLRDGPLVNVQSSLKMKKKKNQDDCFFTAKETFRLDTDILNIKETISGLINFQRCSLITDLII